MSTVDKATDTVLVNRAGTDYRTTVETVSALEDTDLLLVNRGGVDYRCEAKDVKAALGGGGGATEIGEFVIAGMTRIAVGPDGVSLLAWHQEPNMSEAGTGVIYTLPITAAVRRAGQAWCALTVIPGKRSGIPHNTQGNTLAFIGAELGTFTGTNQMTSGTVPHRVVANDVYFKEQASTIINAQTSFNCLCHGPAGTLVYFMRDSASWVFHTTDFFATAPTTVSSALAVNSSGSNFVYLPKSGIYLCHTQNNAGAYRYSTDALNWTAATNGTIGSILANPKFTENADGSIILSIGQGTATGSYTPQGAIRSIDKGRTWTWSNSGFTSIYPMFYMGPWFINGQFRILTKQGATSTTEGPIRIMSSVDGVTWAEGPDLTSAFANFTPSWGTQNIWSASDGQDAYLVGQRKDGAQGITILPNKYFA
jgi:hypothetical protein